MKTKILQVAAMAVMLTAIGCKTKQVTNTQPVQSGVDAEIAEIERQTKLIQAQTQLEIAKRDAELRLAQTHQVNTTMEWHPCMQNSVGVANDVLLGFGISDQSRDRTEALLNANAVAVADIAGRMVGVIQTGVERYAETGYAQSGNRLDQSSLENLASAVGEKAINKMGHITCREIATDNKTGMFVGYVSLNVPLKATVDEITLELEKAGLTVDKNNFRNMVNTELEKQNQQRNQEIEALKAARGM
jgi:hypothetical protein